MSKMSQLHAELEEQAYEKGYESLDEALKDGATIIGETLVTKDDLPSKKSVDERQQAHEAWLKEREEVISGLKCMLDLWSKPYTDYELAYALGQCKNNIGKAIEFIQKGEM